MLEHWTLACTVTSFSREDNTSAPLSSYERIKNNASKYFGQAFTSKIIYFSPNPAHKKRPPVIVKAQNNLKKCFLNPFEFEIGKLSFHQDKYKVNGLCRKVRSEFRSPLHNEVLQAILHYTDRKEMKVGWMNNGIFEPISIRKIEKSIDESRERQGIAERIGYKRLLRFIGHFEKNGYLNLIPRHYRRTQDGALRSKSSIIQINPKMFSDLGITEEDFGRLVNKEESEFERCLRAQKSYYFKVNARAKNKEAKKQLKGIRELLKKSKTNKKLTPDEKAILALELPGYNRPKNEQPQKYRDYTNCSEYLSSFKPPS